ncbi:Peptidoglycan/LPS O-acetylase OafA/YrhL, contains acyltransferase and SGNH-hydrolase domains [Bosea lupini]|uniref:Peptidoglycan/LPS O-acetylase OafA/YrhL, contains acyltransferase and SGNH-hydrolase domains n=1 Tax=Bosea lupini TaxID=1036779 RepID=A0A1H7I5H4_9HYPH|nr:acyltransferase [Bosea lupini]SEK57823.1 Peptidoglycan/LPS O-acetylase OafA/YrhL, contains acyltransferase and SGNH-hydrolase domains [Bosea lupini]
MTGKTGEARQNQAIQVLRGVAALLVVIGHAIHETQAMGSALGRAPLDGSLLRWSTGVDIFFVISGFIMVYSSTQLFERPGGWRSFLWRRFVRIVPLYWLLTTLLLLGALVAPRLLNVPIDDWRHVLASYLFIPSLRAPGEIRPVMALGWTLNLEMFFYVLFACTLALPMRLAVPVLTAILAVLAGVGLAFEPTQVQLAFWTQSIILEFAFGCLLALAYLGGLRLGAPTALVLACAGMAGLVQWPALADQQWPDALRWGVPALMIVSAAALHRGASAARGRPSRLLGVAVLLGNASYSLYLVHPFVLRPLRNLWTQAIGDALPLTAYVVVATAASCVTALLLYRYAEQPLLRAMRSRRPEGAGEREARSPLPAQRSLRTTT